MVAFGRMLSRICRLFDRKRETSGILTSLSPTSDGECHARITFSVPPIGAIHKVQGEAYRNLFWRILRGDDSVEPDEFRDDVIPRKFRGGFGGLRKARRCGISANGARLDAAAASRLGCLKSDSKALAKKGSLCNLYIESFFPSIRWLAQRMQNRARNPLTIQRELRTLKAIVEPHRRLHETKGKAYGTVRNRRTMGNCGISGNGIYSLLLQGQGIWDSCVFPMGGFAPGGKR